MKAHQKHAKLTKPSIGNFARNELALVGAPCGFIQEYAKKLIDQLQIENCTYIDADHAFGDSETEGVAFNEITDKIKFFRSDKKKLDNYDQKVLLNDQDLVLVNGNHFQAKSQIVFIHPKKEASLKKRVDQLTNIKAIILCGGATQVYDWLESKAPVFEEIEIDKVVTLLKETLKPASTKALILAGGKSTRMGKDKGQLNYHGLPQVEFLKEQFNKLGIESFISCRADQYLEENRITDKFEGLGPFGAIASAFQSDPNAAWLVLACDLPAVESKTIAKLVEARDHTKYATCFHNPETGFPDPLFTIWEPKSYMRLLEFLALGHSCPRKVLINSDIKEIKLEDTSFLLNVNSPEQLEAFLRKG